jgi:molecular chaperone DnaJ
MLPFPSPYQGNSCQSHLGLCLTNIGHGHRSLTKRQRDLLQQYADDVEGRAHSPPAKGPQTTKSDEAEETSSHNQNGTENFTPHSPSSGGWMSRIWKNIRGLTGF